MRTKKVRPHQKRNYRGGCEREVQKRFESLVRGLAEEMRVGSEAYWNRPANTSAEQWVR